MFPPPPSNCLPPPPPLHNTGPGAPVPARRREDPGVPLPRGPRSPPRRRDDRRERRLSPLRLAPRQGGLQGRHLLARGAEDAALALRVPHPRSEDQHPLLGKRAPPPGVPVGRRHHKLHREAPCSLRLLDRPVRLLQAADLPGRRRGQRGGAPGGRGPAAGEEGARGAQAAAARWWWWERGSSFFRFCLDLFFLFFYFSCERPDLRPALRPPARRLEGRPLRPRPRGVGRRRARSQGAPRHRHHDARRAPVAARHAGPHPRPRPRRAVRGTRSGARGLARGLGRGHL